MNSREFLCFYRRAMDRANSLQAHDIAVLCALAEHPGQTLGVQQIADAMGTVYYVAWNALKRLQLKGLVLGGRLTEAGLAVMGIDADLAATSSAASPSELY